MSEFRNEVSRFYATYNGKSLPLGQGCAWLGGGTDEAGLKRYQATLDLAYQSGIRYYDTSAQYGGSEFRVGDFVRRIDRKTIFLATKSPIPAVYTPKEAALHMKQALRSSLERLGVAQLDLFQVHDVENLDQVFAPGGAIETLLEAREQGLTRYIGLGVRYHDLLETAVRNGFDTILTYSDYTPLRQTAAGLIRFAAQSGAGVINGSPLMFGLLTGDDPRQKLAGLNGEWRGLVRPAARLYDFAQSQNLPVLALALQFPMRNPDISLTLTGAASPDELRATLDACTTKLPETVWPALAQTVDSE